MRQELLEALSCLSGWLRRLDHHSATMRDAVPDDVVEESFLLFEVGEDQRDRPCPVRLDKIGKVGQFLFHLFGGRNGDLLHGSNLSTNLVEGKIGSV